jgi:hypothetical protein
LELAGLASGTLGANLASSQQIGDVVAFHFQDEEEVALFIPGSADVLLCDLKQWSQLRNSSKASVKSGVPVADIANGAHTHPVESELMVMLRTLGASIT